MFHAARPLVRFMLPGMSLLLAALAAPGWAADPVGRVLVAVGDVAALRGGQALPLNNGSTVEVGDQVRTGPASNAQIRFADSAIISIKPQTVFTVTEFVFNGSEDGSEKAVFNLIRGGFRTVTGLIGHINKKNYELRTPTATVGIRGTVWGAHFCVADECKNGDGSSAKPGTYGEVKAGAVAVANNAPEVVFGPNSAFYVADLNTQATRLLYAPDFVIDQLRGRTRNAGRGGSETGSVNIANTGNGSITPVVAISPPLIYAAANNTTPSGTSAILPVVSGITGFVVAYAFGPGAFDSFSSCNSGGGGGGGCNSNEPTTWTFNGNQIVSYGGATNGYPTLTQTATAANVQTLDMGAAGQFVVGQLVGSYAGTTSSGTPFSGPGGFVYGATNSSLVASQVSLPASGSFTFGYPGPFIGLAADSAGNVGTFSQFSGTYNAGSRAVSFAATANFASIVGYGSATITLGGSGTLPGNSDQLNGGTLGWGCTGAGCQSGGGSGAFDARFLRSASSIPVQVISGGLFNATKSAGGGNSVVFVGALKCVSGGC
jgi:hypothetical protein